MNRASEEAATQEPQLRYLVMFALVVVLYVLTHRHVLVTSTAEVEAILHRIRIRITERILRTDLLALEQVGRSEIYAAVNREMVTVSQSISIIVSACQSAILVLFSGLYIAWLSLFAFVVTLAFIVVALQIHFRRQPELNRQLMEATQKQNELFDAMTDLLDGFKEVQLNSARGHDLLEHVRGISTSVADIKTDVQRSFAKHYTFSQSLSYLCLGALVFVVPQFSSADYGEVVVKTTTALLFILGPLSAAVVSIPFMANANTACSNIERLEETLDRTAQMPAMEPVSIDDFEQITLENVDFEYPEKGERGFHIGPVNLTISKGELLFLSGGNGSGKSSVLKLLTTLYPARRGTIHVDGVEIDDSTRNSYRNLFSVVFTDYHLFRRLFGLRDVDRRKVAELLALFGLDDKTRLTNGEFATIDLSGGQRKRLALVVALLEDRPICVFDEPTADQDPEFRRRFYGELLKMLKEQGKTVIAVTHDERYFGIADRTLRMEDGRIVGAVEPRPSTLGIEDARG